VKSGGSKRKGSSFERVVCVNLSKWISHGEREDIFWRSSLSGGRATIARKGGKVLQSQAGDITAIHPSGQPYIDNFYTEIKHYNSLDYDGLLTNTGLLSKFWKSTVAEAKFYKRHPALIAKQNHKPIVIFFQIWGFRFLDLTDMQCVITAPKAKMYGFLFDDFVKLAKPPQTSI